MIIKVNYTVSDIYMSTSVSPVYIKVVYSGTSGGGTWGTITGTLSAQTDLQAALDLKVPTSRTLTINGVAFDLSANRAWTIASGVTSVGLSMPSAFSVGSSPITSSGTIAVTGAGTTGQYIDGSGALQTFPTIPSISGLVPYTGATGSVNLGAYNFTANNVFTGFSTITASGTQVVLTITSVPEIQVIGSGGQTIKLPDATTLANGTTYRFNNNQSSGAILVNNNSNTLVASVPSGAYVDIVLLSNSIAAGSWDRHDLAPANVSWSTNTFDYPGSITSATWNGNAVAVNRGGTGASTAGGALTNLGAVGTTRNINTSLPLTGGGDLSADRTLSIPAATTSVNGYLTSTDWNTFNGKQAALTLTTTGTSGAATLVGATLNIPQYSGGGAGMAIGGAITSATAGSVLFAGTSGVLQQDNANLFWDDTNNRLGIGTSTPTFTLDVNGNSRVTGTFRQKTSGGSNYFDLVANADGSNPYITAFKSGVVEFKVEFGATIGASFIVGATILFGNSSGTPVNAKVGGLLATGTVESSGGVFGLSSTTNNYIVFQQSGSSSRGTIGFATGTSYLQIRTGSATNLTDGTLSTVFFSSGNVSIGTSTTDAGFKLDVNGTARVTGMLTINSGSANTYITIGTGTGNARFVWSSYSLSISGVKTICETLIGDQSGTATNSRASSTIDCVGYFVTNSIGIGTGSSSINTSAIAQIDSTTKGFLPPRMTTSERNAISSPATGLQVYDTTLGSLNVYNGTSWVALGASGSVDELQVALISQVYG